MVLVLQGENHMSIGEKLDKNIQFQYFRVPIFTSSANEFDFNQNIEDTN